MKKIHCIILLFIVSFILTAQKNKPNRSLEPTNPALYEWKQFDVNRINATINSAGPYADYVKTNRSGLEWPKGSGKNAVFTAGIWFIGKHHPTDSLRTAVMDYQTEFRPGPILSTFNTSTNDGSVAANPNDKKFRIYKINSGDNELNNIDYAEWPGELGAPYIDVNNNKQWDKGIDKPKLYGDQTLWCVYNDIDSLKHLVVGRTKPMGLEVQTTYFGYNYNGVLGDVMFMKWTVINKSDAQYDSMYVGLWSDTDLGDANDDMSAVDTIRNLSITYNGDNNDGTSNGYGTRPPADGFVLLQGPHIPSPFDSAFINGIYIKKMKNLGATAHTTFIGGGSWQDPPLGQFSFAPQTFNVMKGMISTKGTPFINPVTTLPTKFVFSGDPVTGEGWTQSKSGISPTDIRSLLSSGPFTLAVGDTQEIIGTFMIAQGSDRLQSITFLRQNADYVRDFYRSGFSRFPLLQQFSNAILDQNDTSVTIQYKVSVLPSSPIKQISMNLYHLDSTFIAKQILYDDGMHNDSAAGDGFFANTFTGDPKQTGITGDLFIIQNNDSTEINRSILKVQPLLPITVSKVNVLKDETNFDGVINPEEKCTISFSVTNNTRWLWKQLLINITSSPSIVFYPSQNPFVYNNLAPFGSTIGGTGTCVFSINKKIQYDSLFTIYYTITDTAYGFSWKDSLRFPVKVLLITPEEPIPVHMGGVGSGTIGVRILNTNELKNNKYRAEIAGDGTLQFINQSTNDTLFRGMQLFPDHNFTQLIPVTEGFKLTQGTLSAYSNIAYGVYEINGANGVLVTKRWPDQTKTEPGLSVFRRPNSTTEWDIGSLSNINGYSGTVSDLTTFTDDGIGYDFEVRFTNTGSEYYIGNKTDSMYTKAPNTVPFEIWRFRHMNLPPLQRMERMVIHILDTDGNGTWTVTPDSLKAEPIFGERPNGAYPNPLPPFAPTYATTDLQLHSLYFSKHLAAMDFAPPSMGTVIRIVTTQTLRLGDVYEFNPLQLLGVSKTIEPVPTRFELSQNYPNPFNPTTTIGYSLPVRSYVTLTIFNVLGQRVSTLVNDIKDAGNYRVDWNGKNEVGNGVASGIYFYQIKAEGYTVTKKMLLLR